MTTRTRGRPVADGWIDRRPEGDPLSLAAGVRSVVNDAWRDYAFGEPSATVLPDGTILLGDWCGQPAGPGIGVVKLAREDA